MSKSRYSPNNKVEFLAVDTNQIIMLHYNDPILRTVFETEAETLILPLEFDLTEKAETRIRPLVMENCPDY